MSNPQYIAIFNQKIERFIRSFEVTREIYSDELQNNKCYHNGEFGKSRENACVALLANTICTNFNISNGFVVNYDGGRTTQCDVVIYDPRHHPIQDSSTGTQFFPAESVAAIGEVKSCLDTSSLCTALVKLANNKGIRDALNGTTLCDTMKNQQVSVDTRVHNTTAPFTFLICEQIEGCGENLASRIANYYVDHDVPRYLQHNLILSIKDGLFTYCGDEVSRIIGERVGFFPYPKLKHEQAASTPVFIPGDTVLNVRGFLISVSNSLENAHCFYPEPTKYL
jgi:hypothetical protein